MSGTGGGSFVFSEEDESKQQLYIKDCLKNNKHYELPADYLLITSDTVVICEGEILGKPKNREDATRMLQLLSGKTHHVVTGVTVRSAKKTESFAVRSNVTFAQLDDEEIDYYIEHCKPFDKAGAYGIQEWIGYVGISGLEGSFYNVMGLPTRKLYQCLKDF
jgi:septum formation protein